MRSIKISYKKIIDTLSENGLLISHNIKNTAQKIGGISQDSRKVSENSLLFCKGANFKGEYLYEAVQKGAVCYISETEYGAPVNHIIVKDIIKSIALMAPLYYGYPSKNLILTGITGTKGKTTTAYFLKNILDEFTNSKTALSSSIEKYTGIRLEEAHLNTPELCDLQEFFYEAAFSGIKYFTMEVSSQAYKRNRLEGVKFDNGIFLNIAEDHIGEIEHLDFEDYFSCKLEFLKNCSNIIINRETDCFERVLKAAQSSDTLQALTLFGSEKIKDKCDYYYTDIKKDGKLINFRLIGNKNGYSQNFTLKIPGLFNVENAAAAAVMSISMGVDCESIKSGLLKTEVCGRMTVLENGEITVIVDYAHNFLSFTKLYESLRADYSGKKIISLGGAPGGKAYRRRKDFAEIVGKNSDHIYLTAEDPQYEDPVKICGEIAGYMPNVSYEIIPDRTAAVEKAVGGAKAGDVVVLLAKGDENYQKVDGKWEFYESDLKIAQRILRDL